MSMLSTSFRELLMKFRSLSLLALGASLLFQNARAAEPRWTQHAINANSAFEAAGACDVNHDGKLDIISGDTWYEAPKWTPHHVRDVAKIGTYYADFATLPLDVNHDGNVDFVTCSYFDKSVAWVENPGAAGKPWTYHEIDKPGNIECATLADLNGDGVPDVLPNAVNTVVWYSLDNAGLSSKFTKHDLGTAAAGHGVGSGDVNGDGRVDLLTPKGWFESPADPNKGAWSWHPEWSLGSTGIQILARDVDGDGLADVVFGSGHNYGLFWMKQSKSADGSRSWTKSTIDDTIASVHTLIWADLNGDGTADELVTGKRVYAHEIEPGATDGSVIASYRFERDASRWAKSVIFQGKPAKDAPTEGPKRDAMKDFPAGTAGTGLQMTAIDLDKDGDLDLLCPGKSGLYWFENLGK